MLHTGDIMITRCASDNCPVEKLSYLKSYAFVTHFSNSLKTDSWHCLFGSSTSTKFSSFHFVNLQPTMFCFKLMCQETPIKVENWTEVDYWTDFFCHVPSKSLIANQLNFDEFFFKRTRLVLQFSLQALGIDRVTHMTQQGSLSSTSTRP